MYLYLVTVVFLSSLEFFLSKKELMLSISQGYFRAEREMSTSIMRWFKIAQKQKKLWSLHLKYLAALLSVTGLGETPMGEYKTLSFTN